MRINRTIYGYGFILSILLGQLSACSCDSDSNSGLDDDGDGGQDAGDSIISADASLADGPAVVGLTDFNEGDPIEGWVLGECTITPVADPFENPNTELHWRGADLPFPDYEQVINTPIVVDFVPEAEGEDMVPEIAFIGYVSFNGDGVLRVVHGRPPYTNLLTFTGDGTAAIAHPNTDPGTADPNLLFDTHPAAGDLNGDGHPEIVAIREDTHVVAFTYDVSSQTFIELWTTSFSVGGNPAVAIANIDQTGEPEVIVGRYVINGLDGTQRWVGTGGSGTNNGGPVSCVADIVDDPSAPGMEIIGGATVYGSDGDPLWPPPEDGDGDLLQGFCAVGDLLNNDTMATGKDGSPEFVRVSESEVFVHDPRLSSQGAVLWQVDLPQCDYDTGAFTCTQDCPSGNAGGAPTVADFDGDGNMEIGVAGGTCYVVIDPDCRGGSVPGCVLDGILWAFPTNDGSSNVTSSTVFDFNGDGKAEVIYNDQDRFLVLDGQTGTQVFEDWNPSRTRTEQPAIADVDNDGNAEIVFVANTEAPFAGAKIPAGEIRDRERIPGVEIWSSGDDAWVGARKIWNQHTYHIDNINEDGTVPLEEAASWLTHNSYRLNAPVGDQLVSPDLGAAGAGVRCSSGIIYVCAQLLNSGDVLVGPGMEVSFYTDDASGMLIGTTETVRNVLPGTYGESLCVPWNPVTHPAVSNIYVEIDPNSNTRECHEDNNSLSFSAGIPSCGTI